MGGKIIEKYFEIASIISINVLWLFIIFIWFLSGFDNELGRIIRTYCFGYGAYTNDVIIMKIISMILPPAFISLTLTILFFKSKFFRRAISISAFLLITLSLFLSIVKANMRASQIVNSNKEIPLDIEFTDIDGNSFNFSRMKDKEFILTFFYISCHGSCPLIIYEVKKLTLKSNIPVIMVSLNPSDDIKKLRAFYFENGFKNSVKIIRAERENLIKFIESLNLSIKIPENVNENSQIEHPVVFIKCKGNTILNEVYGLNIGELIK